MQTDCWLLSGETMQQPNGYSLCIYVGSHEVLTDTESNNQAKASKISISTTVHNRGRRLLARAISSIGTVPIIWDNFATSRTNCAIACGTRACMLRVFSWMSRGGASEIPEIFYALIHNSMRLCLLEFYF